MENSEDTNSSSLVDFTPELKIAHPMQPAVLKIADIAKIYQPQIKAFTTSLAPTLLALEKVNKAYTIQVKTITQNLSPTLLAIEKVVKTYQPQIDAFAKNISPTLMAIEKMAETYRPQIQAFIEGAKRFEEFNIDLVERHKKEELILPPFFANLTLPEIYELFEDKDKSAIEIYNNFFLNSENIESLIASWSEIKFYNERLPILKDALYAHKNGTHTLSTPVLLSQIEGILCEILEVKDHAKAKGKLNKINFEENDDKYPFATPKIITHILVNQIFQSSDLYKDDKNYPNRHPIVHGKDKYYYEDKYASLRCILILDSLRLEKFMTLT